MDHHEAGVWPGYVAALAGLMQGLLLLTAVIGISIYAVGKEMAEKPTPASAAGTPARADEAVGPASGPIVGEAPAAASTPGRVVPVRQRPSLHGQAAADGMFELDFSPDAWSLPDAQARELEQDLRSAAVPGGHWRVWVDTDVEDPDQRRAAFLRLMSVRNALVAAGADPDSLDVRLRPAPPSRGDGIQRVWIAPEPGGTRSSAARPSPLATEPAPREPAAPNRPRSSS